LNSSALRGAFLLYDALMRTLRVRVVGQVFSKERPSIFFFWHRNLLPLPHVFRNTPIRVMVSPSRDGRLIGSLVELKGLGVIWSSQHKSPLRGVISVVRALREGWNVAITPDGPKGPARCFKVGTLELARRSGARIVFVGVGFSAAYRLNTWDSLRVPMPLSSVAVVVEEAYPESPEEAARLLDDLDARAFNYLEI